MPVAQDLLQVKNDRGESEVASISEDASVLEAARLMNQRRIGSLVVLDHRNELSGIFTERDVLMRVVAAERDPARTKVKEVMTTDVVTCGRADRLANLRRVMREQRVRHIPVVEAGRVVGMVSIGDLNAALAEEMSQTIQYLEQYISPM